MFDLEFSYNLLRQGLTWEGIIYISIHYPELEEIIVRGSKKVVRIVFSLKEKTYSMVQMPVRNSVEPGEDGLKPTDDAKPEENPKSITLEKNRITLSNKTSTFVKDKYDEMKLFYSKFPKSFLDNYSILVPEKYKLNYERIIDTQINHNQRLYFKVISNIIKTKEIEFMTPILEESKFYKPVTVKVESQNKQSVLTIEMDGEVLNMVTLN